MLLGSDGESPLSQPTEPLDACYRPFRLPSRPEGDLCLMRNNGLFSTLFIEEVAAEVSLDDAGLGRMATLTQTWGTRKAEDIASLWETFLKQAGSYLGFVPPNREYAPGIYPLYEDWGFSQCITVLLLVEPGGDIDDTSVGRFYPAKLLTQLRQRKLNWGILTDGAVWRLYSTKSSRPYEDFVELPLAQALEASDEAEYGLFERFFHKDSFIPEEPEEGEGTEKDEAAGVYKCKLDKDRERSEKVLDYWVKEPLLYQVDEVLQYLCNGFIHDTQKTGDEYTEEERAEIFESAVKLLYRCLFLFYAEARSLLPSDPDKADVYQQHSIQALCKEAREFRWGSRHDTDQHDLWKNLKGLVAAVNDGDPEYGIMGYNGGLFDDSEEVFLGEHQLRNDFLSRALYLLAYVEPFDNKPEDEYPIPYEDLEVRHLGELYENILEYTVMLADADRIRRRTKKGVELLLASQTSRQSGDTLIKKGEVFFGESALERKQTGSYYTPEPLVRFLNEKTIIKPLQEAFEKDYRPRFNEFIKEAHSGRDIGTRRGAAQSVTALIQRFIEEVVLPFKVCDPAMGSGHFLVDASNQMAGFVVSLLEEVPYIEGMSVPITSNPNDWRRRITRHCLYGVDLNPLAVTLAKLSLWLNCFAINHKLTFLDHHLALGNSLIGIRSLGQLKEIPKRKKDGKTKSDKPLFDFDDVSGVLADAAKELSSITAIDEDNTEAQKMTFEEAHQETVNRLGQPADLYTAYLMDPSITPQEYKTTFESLARGVAIRSPLHPALEETWASVGLLRARHHFFHWPLEFPEVFGSKATGGFSAVVGNPPWDRIKPYSQEFFSAYDPDFRSYQKQAAIRVSKELMDENSDIKDKWDEYCESFDQQRDYFKESNSYEVQGQGEFNTYKLFLERFFAILNEDGFLGIIVPSSFYADHGCQPLRELFFFHTRIDSLICFENKLGIFNIHRMYKFILFCARKGGETAEFKCAFMEHDPDRLPIIYSDALLMSIEDIRKFSPESLSIMEFNNQQEVRIASTLYEDQEQFGPYLKNVLNSDFQREFHMTDDSSKFIHADDDTNHELLPLLEGKQFWILSSNALAKPTYFMTTSDARKKPTTNSTRLAYRAVSASTNERTFIPIVVPRGIPTGNTVNICPLSCEEAVYLASITSAFVWDWVLRNKVTTSLNIFVIHQIPMIDIKRNEFPADVALASILARGCRLMCNTEEYRAVWNDIYDDSWQSPDFWYPPSSSIDYGSASEKETRYRLRDQAVKLTQDWSPQCGANDRLPDGRDTGDRAQLRAEIDAYVAHLFRLNRVDFEYILDTFPVLRRKEEQAFGEYMSKRKCLEEYDRIGQILREVDA